MILIISENGALIVYRDTETKPAIAKADEWAERIAAQQRSGISVKKFCKEHGLTECSFHA